jgi:hypothetical protein
LNGSYAPADAPAAYRDRPRAGKCASSAGINGS